MTNKLRNTVYLLVVLVLFIAIGWGWYGWYQPRQIKALKKEIDAVQKKLEDLPGLQDEVQKLTLQFQDIKRRYDSRSKEIPQSDISSQTYEYLDKGMNEGGYVQFDMKFLGTKTKSSWGYNAYSLDNGKAQFDNLFKFIYFLENGQRLYKVTNLDLTQREQEDPETKEILKWIDYKMEVHAYFVQNIPELGTSLASKSLAMVAAPYDPFTAMITEVISKEAPYGEINADNIEIKAVLPGKTFVQAGGMLSVMHLGDKVWRGSITNILPEESAVIFTLNEGGVIRTLKKQIMFEKNAR